MFVDAGIVTPHQPGECLAMLGEQRQVINLENVCRGKDIDTLSTWRNFAYVRLAAYLCNQSITWRIFFRCLDYDSHV